MWQAPYAKSHLASLIRASAYSEPLRKFAECRREVHRSGAGRCSDTKERSASMHRQAATCIPLVDKPVVGAAFYFSAGAVPRLFISMQLYQLPISYRKLRVTARYVLYNGDQKSNLIERAAGR